MVAHLFLVTSMDRKRVDYGRISVHNHSLGFKPHPVQDLRQAYYHILTQRQIILSTRSYFRIMWLKFIWKKLKRRTIANPLFELIHSQSTGSYHVPWFLPHQFHGVSDVFSLSALAGGLIWVQVNISRVGIVPPVYIVQQRVEGWLGQ